MSFIHSYSLLIMAVAALTIILSALAVYIEYRKAKNRQKRCYCRPLYRRVSKTAVLIASKDGEKTIAKTVKAAIANKVDVYVVSDGSTDKTGRMAKEAGAKVLRLRKNVGKPAALYRGYKHFMLSQNYSAIAILDDDVTIEVDFIKQVKKAMDGNAAITVGKNLTYWPKSKRWNIWLASRAYSYWAYQITLRNIQSSYNVMSCISGSNSLYRTEVLDQVLTGDTPYIVDDTYWTLETHRLQLGKIRYAAKARSWLQDPTNFRDWYKQNLRWMWGSFQGIIGHKIGTKTNRFHLSYIALMFDWIIYILSGPLTILVIWEAGLRNLWIELLLLSVGYSIVVFIAAVFLKLPRLVFFIPAIILVDFLFRAVMVHGLIKAIRQPTVENCIWNSPSRLDMQAAEA